jgi:hypothetical protein
MTEGGTFELLTAPLHTRAEECMQRFVKWAKLPASDGYIKALRIIQRNVVMNRQDREDDIDTVQSQLLVSVLRPTTGHVVQVSISHLLLPIGSLHDRHRA